MTGRPTPDVLVVGGGAIGAATAHELARRGAVVVLVEREHALGVGCSSGNAGLICPSHAAPLASPRAVRDGLRWLLVRDSPFSVRLRPRIVPWLARFALASTPARADAAMRLVRSLGVASLELHAALAAAGIDGGFTRRGVLNVYETDERLEAGLREAALHEAAGMRSEPLDAPGARMHEPALEGPIAGGILYPDEAHCDPARLVRTIGEAAAEAGADVRVGVEVLGLQRSVSGITVETTAGPIHPGAVVLAAGSWTPRLAADLGVFVPVEGGKGYHVDFERRPGDPETPVFLREAHVIVTPLSDRLRVAGTLQLSGLDLAVDRVRLAAIVRSAQRLLPLGGRRVLDVWRGLRPCSPDGLPILGRPRGNDDVVLATAHAMMGVTLAPVTGLLAAQMVAGEATSFDVGALRPDRFRPFRLRTPVPPRTGASANASRVRAAGVRRLAP